MALRLQKTHETIDGFISTNQLENCKKGFISI